MASQLVRFEGSTGQLAGRLDLPTGEIRAWALFAHCFTCSKDLRAVRNIARELNQHHIAVLRFDFTGLGESEGDFVRTDFQSNLDDLESAASYLRESHQAPQLLIGHSLGGAAVLAVASRLPEVRAVATIGAPASTHHLATNLSKTVLSNTPEDDSPLEVALGGRSFKVGRQLLTDLEGDHVEQQISNLRRALLILHSPIDEIVGIDEARQLYQAARHPKSFVSLDDADHLLTRECDANYAAAVLATWASRYVEAALTHTPVPPGTVIAELGPRGFTTTLATEKHLLVADEPASVGGADLGPNPYELLLASLGACTVMTLRMYARRKKWPMEGAKVALRHGRIHAKDCEDCTQVEGKVDVIDIELELHGNLDQEQRARLLEIAHRCPVHRTLTTETKIGIELV